MSLEIKALLFAAIAAMLLGCGFAGGLRWDEGVIQRMKADDARAALQARQQADQITAADAALANANAAKDAATQQALATHATVVTKEIPVYVTAHQDATGCVTWGMLRVHDAAALGVDPSSLQPPGGQSDDACSTVKPSAFAAAVAGNYAIAIANAAQLNDLEADIRGRVAAFNKGALTAPAK